MITNKEELNVRRTRHNCLAVVHFDPNVVFLGDEMKEKEQISMFYLQR